MPKFQTTQAAMSIDVEDWFQVENLKGIITRDTWDDRDLRVEANTDKMLELMDKHDVKCTCFILGWVAENALSSSNASPTPGTKSLRMATGTI